MTDLDQFDTQIRSAVIGTGYEISGVAKVETLGLIYYSASLVSLDPKMVKPDLNSVYSKFQRLKVCNFVFSKCEILTFKSNLSLPKPNWRVQIKYTI